MSPNTMIILPVCPREDIIVEQLKSFIIYLAAHRSSRETRSKTSYRLSTERNLDVVRVETNDIIEDLGVQGNINDRRRRPSLACF